MLTAGSTGAALAGGVAYAGRIRGVRTPALATFLPSIPGRRLCLADCGANVDCKPERMEQFALMATALMQSCGVEEPRVGLLSVGVEESKGSHFIREVYDLLERLPIRFTGMMEARDALSGEYDVIVAEGFSGNVLLKTVEGTGLFTAARLRASTDRCRRRRHYYRRAGLCLKRRVHAARPAKALPEGARQRKHRHFIPNAVPRLLRRSELDFPAGPCRGSAARPHRPSCCKPEKIQAPGFRPASTNQKKSVGIFRQTSFRIAK